MIIHTDITRFYHDVIEQEEYGYLFRDYTVIDIGCNTGMFSLSIASMSDIVHAIDISSENIENLDKTIKDSSISNIKTYLYGISDKTEIKLINQSGDAGSGGWRLDPAGTRKINAFTLKDFMNEFKIERANIVKMDIEGEEVRVVNEDFPFDRVGTVIGEYHYESSVRSPFEDIFRRNGFDFIWHPNDHFIARK